MSLILHFNLISVLNNLPIVFNMIHGRVQFSTSALTVGRKNSIHVVFSPNVAWHWSCWPSGRRGGSRYILHWRCSQPKGDKVQHWILHEPGEWTGESWHSHTLHQGKIVISKGYTDGSVGWVSYNHTGGCGFEPRPDHHSGWITTQGIKNNWGESAAFVMMSENLG